MSTPPDSPRSVSSSQKQRDFEETWARYSWLSADIKKHRRMHERAKAGIKGTEEDNGVKDDADERRRNRAITRAKLAMTRPRYSHFEELKRSSSLGGLYHPRAGSSAGRLKLLQARERDKVAFSAVCRELVPDWAFEIGLEEADLKELTLDLIERKWQKGKEGGAERDGGQSDEKNAQRKLQARLEKKRKQIKAKPVVVAMRNFRKTARRPQTAPEPEVNSASVYTSQSKDNTARRARRRSALDVKDAVAAAAPPPRKPPSATARGVRVTVSSAGEILSTVKPEYEYLASKPCTFYDIEPVGLTRTLEPATTWNPCLDYARFEETRRETAKAASRRREKVYEAKCRLVKERQDAVVKEVGAKENRRETLRQARYREERQLIFLRAASVIESFKIFGDAIVEGRTKRRIEARRNDAAKIIQRNWKQHFSMRMLKLVMAFKNLGLPFTLGIRIRRKQRGIGFIKRFLEKVKKEAGPQIVKTFMYNVRKAQSYVRTFLACRAARRELCNRYWVKIEVQIRSEMAQHAKERSRASQSVLSEIPDMVETQYKFKAVKSKASKLLLKNKRLEVELDEKWSHVGLVHPRDRVEGGNRGDKVGQVGDESNVSDGKFGNRPQSPSKKDSGKMIDPAIRGKVVMTKVKDMRVAYLDSIKGFVSNKRNAVVGEDEARALVQRGGKGEMQKLKVLAEEMMTTTEVKRPSFFLFTGNYGGINWRAVVEAEIKRDSARRKKSERKIEFRPVQSIDEKIERLKLERKERENRRIAKTIGATDTPSKRKKSGILEA